MRAIRTRSSAECAPGSPCRAAEERRRRRCAAERVEVCDEGLSAVSRRARAGADHRIRHDGGAARTITARTAPIPERIDGHAVAFGNRRLMEDLLGRGSRERSHPRYTRNVVLFWQRGLSLVVLSVLAVLPVSGTMCAALCKPAANAGSVSHEPVSGQRQVQGTSGHDCDRHKGPAHEATARLTGAACSDISLISVTRHVGPGTPNLFALTSVRTHAGSSPPGPAASTRPPLVLRI